MSVTLAHCFVLSSSCASTSQYVDEKEIEDIQYITFLLMARAGLRALEFYDPATQKHGQAHMQARYDRMNHFVCSLS
jgi:dipeptidyl-peptidase-3